MSIRTPHEQSLDYYVITLECFISEMEEQQLRITGKILATVSIATLKFLGYGTGNFAFAAIAAMWVVTIPSIIEAWYIAKDRRKDRMRENTDR